MVAVHELVRSLLANKRQIVHYDWLAIINIMAAEWTDDATVKLVSLYEKNSCLYDVIERVPQ